MSDQLARDERDVTDRARESIEEWRRIAADPDSDPAAAELATYQADTLGRLLADVEQRKAKLADKRTAAIRRAEWLATVKAYRKVRERNHGQRPSQKDVAIERDLGERTLAQKLRTVGIEDWHDVHALIEAMD